jgi:hypothetical protein
MKLNLRSRACSTLRVILVGTISAVLWSTLASAQQQPGITIPLPNVPGVTTPTPQQQQPYYPPQQDQRYPNQRYPDQRDNPSGYSRDTGRCADLASQERDIQSQIAQAPRSGRQHDDLVYQLGQIHNQQNRCR